MSRLQVNCYNCMTVIKGDNVHSIAAHKTCLLYFKFSYIQFHVSRFLAFFPGVLNVKI